jgi:hypothetical protein
MALAISMVLCLDDAIPNAAGEDANERIRVVYAKSAFGHEGQVMRLQYEAASPEKPWWKLW